jgi:hypothetical protein
MRKTAQSPAPTSGRKSDKQGRRQQQQSLQREKEVARQKGRQAARRKRLALTIGGGIVAAAALAGAVALALRGNATSVSENAVAASLGAPTSDVASPPTGAFNHVGAPLYQGGKPELLFIGAQYCPHCAGQRWAIVKALDQFGTFSNVTSSANDDGTIPTFNFHDASYESTYVAFVHKDLEDRNHQPLDSLSSEEQSIFNRLDPSGGIPLITVGGYALLGDGYDLSLIQGKSFNAVQHAMQRGNPTDPLVSAVNGEVNSITAFICHADKMQPQTVCDRPVIRRIVSHLQ